MDLRVRLITGVGSIWLTFRKVTAEEAASNTTTIERGLAFGKAS